MQRLTYDSNNNDDDDDDDNNGNDGEKKTYCYLFELIINTCKSTYSIRAIYPKKKKPWQTPTTKPRVVMVIVVIPNTYNELVEAFCNHIHSHKEKKLAKWLILLKFPDYMLSMCGKRLLFRQCIRIDNAVFILTSGTTMCQSSGAVH